MKTFFPVTYSLLILLTCCDEDLSSRPDYFPLRQDQRIIYQEYAAEALEDFSSPLSDEKIVYVLGDTVYDGHAYTLITNDDCRFRAVREENGAYYQRTYWTCNTPAFDDNETKFLDVKKATGATWTDFVGEHQKISSTIRKRIPVKTFQDKTYRNIIVVERQYFHATQNGGWEFWLSTWHYYASGYGEIYSFSPYPMSYRYQDIGSLQVKIE